MSLARSTVSTGLAFCLTILAVSWAVGVGASIGLQLYDEQYAAAILALALALVFIKPRAGQSNNLAALAFDYTSAVAALGAVGYLAWQYPELVDLVLLRPVDGVIASSITIVLVVVGLRRAAGNVLVGLVILFILYAVGADLVPVSVEGRATDWQKLAGYLAVDVNGILGVPLKIGASIVVPFILFGVLLSTTGAASWFTDFSLMLMGRFRGGAAKIAILASALFGSISGSAVANVVATGVVTIPLIKRSGYAARHAAAIEAVASTGGQLMPPVMGASAFLMAEFLQIPYVEVVLAALVPAVLYYIAVFIQVDLDAAKLGLKPVPKELIPSAKGVLRNAFFVLPFVVLVMLLFSFNFSPATAAVWSAIALLALTLVLAPPGLKPTLKMLGRAVSDTGLAVVDIVLITAAAGIVIGVLGISGLGFNLTLALISIGDGNLFLLLILSALVCIVLGMGLPTVGVYVLLATLVSPALVKVGVEPKAAHLFVMYWHDVHDHTARCNRILRSGWHRWLQCRRRWLLIYALGLVCLHRAGALRLFTHPATYRCANRRGAGHCLGRAGHLVGIDGNGWLRFWRNQPHLTRRLWVCRFACADTRAGDAIRTLHRLDWSWRRCAANDLALPKQS